MNTDIHNDIERNVLRRIEGGARMHSRAYFVLRAAAVVLVSLVVLALSVFVLSFIAFSLYESGEQLLLGFGLRGVETFFGLFPWLALALDIALIFLLEWLLQGFRFGYRFSLLALFCGVAAVSLVLAFLLDLTPLHLSLLQRADRGELPLLGDAYASIRESHEAQGVLRGTVASIENDRIVIMHNDIDHDADDGMRTVVVPQGATTTLHVGERVYVFGTSSGEMVQAYGVGALSPDQQEY